MRIQPENCKTTVGASITSDAFKNTHSVMKAVSHYMHVCLAPRHQLAVHPNEFHRLYHKSNLRNRLILICFSKIPAPLEPLVFARFSLG